MWTHTEKKNSDIKDIKIRILVRVLLEILRELRRNLVNSQYMVLCSTYFDEFVLFLINYLVHFY